MEEMSSAVAVPLRVGNSVCDNPNLATHMDVSRLKLMADAGLLSNSISKVSTETVIDSDEDSNCGNLENKVSISAVSSSELDREREIPVLDTISRNESTSMAGAEVSAPEIEDDDIISLEGDQVIDSSCSLSAVSENSSICGEELVNFEATSEMKTPTAIDMEKSICAQPVDLEEPVVEPESIGGPLAVAVSLEESEVGSGPQPSAVVLELPLEKVVSGTVGRSVFELDYAPLWGYISLCGRRPEMEDAVATVPRFMKIPIQMLIGDRIIDGMSKCLSQQTAHFFGVYDGHGGSQVKSFLYPFLPCLILVILSTCLCF